MNVLSLNPGSSSLKVALIGETTLYRASLPAGSIDDVIRNAQGHGRIDAVACRVVHGADRFTEATLVDDAVLKAIEELAPLAPLHNAADLKTIRAVQKALPNVPVYAAFDTAFHRTIPRVASTYAVPWELAEKHGLRRYGFHGISYAHTAETLKDVPRLRLPPRQRRERLRDPRWRERRHEHGNDAPRGARHGNPLRRPRPRSRRPPARTSENDG